MSFSSDVRRFINKAQGRTDEEFRKLVLQIWVDTVQGTPRITGTLRANWQIGVNQQNAAQRDPGDDFNGQQGVSKLKIEDTAIIFNNIEYAEVVENGLDGTARVPRRMLANAINAAKARRITG